MSRWSATNSATRSRPQTGQWCCAYTTSTWGTNSASASSRYWLQASASRVLAPRIGHRLCISWQAFSARFSARRPGKNRCISAGASEPGVSWNTISTPSITWRSRRCAIDTVGAISAIRPLPTLPSPLST